MKVTLISLLCLVFMAGSPGVRADNTLVVCDDTKDPFTLDPHREFSEKNHTIVQQIFDGLVRFDASGKIEPALAKSWTRLDPLRMRFELREGVKFHNDEPFDSEAVRYSIVRYLNPATQFPAAAFLGSIDRVDIVDATTVDIVTKYPDGLLLNRLAGFVLIVPPRYTEQSPEQLATHPIGTGAFRFVKWDKGEAIHLAANRAYWLTGRPLLDALVFRFVPEDKQVEMLLEGKIDLVTELPGTMTLKVQQGAHTKVDKLNSYWTVGATMKVHEGPLSDVRVRQALNFAINRAELISYDAKGNGHITSSLTLPGEEGHNPNLKPYAFDLAKANALLDAAGVKRPLVLKTLAREQGMRTAGILKAQLAKVGVNLEIEAVVGDAEVMQALAQQPWDMAIAAVPDPMCHSYFIQSILLFSQSPFSLARDTEFDKRIIAMASTLDGQERQQLGESLDQYVYDQALSLFTYQKTKIYGMNKAVTFTPYVSAMPYFFNTSIAAP